MVELLSVNMTDVDIVLEPESAVSVLPVQASRSPQVGWFELCLVLFVAFASPILNSTYVVLHGVSTARPDAAGFRYIAGMVNEVAALLVLFYVLKQNGVGVRSIGLRYSAWDSLTGILLFAAGNVVYFVTAGSLQLVSVMVFGHHAARINVNSMLSGASLTAMAPFILLNPWFEELIVRGYATTALTRLTGSLAISTVVSVVIQTSYHLYQGWVSALAVGSTFVVFAVYFARTKRLMPIIVAHTLMDVLAMISILMRR